MNAKSFSLTVLLMALALSVLGQGCPEPTALIPSAFVLGADKAGSLVYVPDEGVKIYDVSVPASPVLINSFEDTRITASTVKISGNYAFVIGGLNVAIDPPPVCWPSAFYILDVSNPLNPIQLAYLGLGCDPMKIIAAGNFVYVAAGVFYIIDVSVPAAPVIASWYPCGPAQDVELVGQLAYVACGNAGVKILDISNPSAPQLIGSYETPSWATSVTVNGNLAYVAGVEDYIRVLDVSVPAHPVQVGAANWGGYDLEIKNNIIFATDVYYMAVSLFDIGDPFHPIYLWSWPNMSEYSELPRFVTIMEETLLFSRGWSYGLQLLDLSACGTECPWTVDVMPDGPLTPACDESITLTATPTGGQAPYAYQWTENGFNIPTTSLPTLSISKQSAGTFTYNCKVWDYVNGCSFVQDAADVTVNWTGCAGPMPPPPVAQAGSGAARFTKGEADEINVAYDASTCSSQKAVILVGTIGNWDGYYWCAQEDAGNTGSTTVSSSWLSSAWFNIIWTEGTTAGHPGYAFDGTSEVPRTWNAGRICSGVISDDHTRTSCP